MSLLSYMRALFSPKRRALTRPIDFNPAKQVRATYLGQLDRQLSDSEWGEFTKLVKEGY